MAYASADIDYAVDTARLELWTNEWDADPGSNQSTVWAKGQIYIPRAFYTSRPQRLRLLIWSDTGVQGAFIGEESTTRLGDRAYFSVEGTFRMPHRDDGGVTYTINLDWIKDTTSSYVPQSTLIRCVSVGGINIPRASRLESTDWPSSFEGSFVSRVNKPASSLYDTLDFKVEGQRVKFISPYSSGQRWSLSKEELEKVWEITKNTNNPRVEVTLDTRTQRDNGTRVGGNSHASNISIPDKPTAVITPKETGIPNIVSGWDTVQSVSRKQVHVVSSAQKKATISKVFISVSGDSSTGSSADHYGGLVGLTGSDYTIEITDSRGNKTVYKYSGKYYPYSSPKLNTISISRMNDLSSLGTLAVNGVYSKLNIGSFTNKIAVSLITETGTHLKDSLLDSSPFTLSVGLSNVDPKQKYRYRIVISDLVTMTDVTYWTELSQSIPSFWIGKESVQIYGKTIFDMVYPVGSIYMSMNDVSPGDLFGGVWKKIYGRVLMATGGCGPNTTNKHGKLANNDIRISLKDRGGAINHDHKYSVGGHRWWASQVGEDGDISIWDSRTNSWKGGVREASDIVPENTGLNGEYKYERSNWMAAHAYVEQSEVPVLPPYIGVNMWFRIK